MLEAHIKKGGHDSDDAEQHKARFIPTFLFSVLLDATECRRSTVFQIELVHKHNGGRITPDFFYIFKMFVI